MENEATFRWVFKQKQFSFIQLQFDSNAFNPRNENFLKYPYVALSWNESLI